MYHPNVLQGLNSKAEVTAKPKPIHPEVLAALRRNVGLSPVEVKG